MPVYLWTNVDTITREYSFGTVLGQKMVLELMGSQMDHFSFNLGCRVNGIAGINEVNARPT
jgi:hypothetical protein